MTHGAWKGPFTLLEQGFSGLAIWFAFLTCLRSADDIQTRITEVMHTDVIHADVMQSFGHDLDCYAVHRLKP